MMNFLLLTYDSCRYDVLASANTPVLDSYSTIYCAEAPANFTFASHQAFFVGILPYVKEFVPYYNRFKKQLLGLAGVGEGQVSKTSFKKTESNWNLVYGLKSEGYQTIGAGAANWFRQETLKVGFEKFLFTGTDADRQINFLLENIDITRPFFGFINFGETHAPYTYRGEIEACKDDVRARRMIWPPIQNGPVGVETDAFKHQVAAAEFLDGCLPRLFDPLPKNTIVILVADHGDCFGEDGYWGHGVNHRLVFEVPLSIFRLDRQPLDD
jgi:hypothetical protein